MLHIVYGKIKDLEEENEELYDEIALLKGKNIEKDLQDGIMVSEDELLEEDIF